MLQTSDWRIFSENCEAFTKRLQRLKKAIEKSETVITLNSNEISEFNSLLISDWKLEVFHFYSTLLLIEHHYRQSAETLKSS